jgi:hypothetical protein
VIKPGLVGTLVIRMNTGNLGLIDRAGNAMVVEPTPIVITTYVSA